MASGGVIVLAEDDVRMRRLYVDSLSAAGFNVMAAGDGIEALSLISKVTPRLVILDIMMPRLNGIETCTRARKIIGDDVPILFLSALDRIGILRDCLVAGGDDYLIKSKSIESLVERIKTWLQHAQRQGLKARRTKLLHDLSVKITSSESTSSKAPPSPAKGSNSDMASLLVLVQGYLGVAQAEENGSSLGVRSCFLVGGGPFLGSQRPLKLGLRLLMGVTRQSALSG